MRGSQYTEEFKLEAVNFAINSDLTVGEVAQNLGVKYKTLYNWVKKAMPEAKSPQAGKDKVKALEAEIKSLRRELSKTRQEREILKKAAAYFASQKL
jgi:transposase